MNVIYKERGAGKSTELVKRSAETGIYILVTNRDRALALSKIADDLGLHIPFPVTLSEFYDNKFKGSYIKEIMIDDADDILIAIFHMVHIDTITLSMEKFGEWKFDYDTMKRICSECGCKSGTPSSFCPRCGTKMRTKYDE